MNTNKKCAVILLSGGLDSFVSLDIAAKKFDVKLALTFNYGQKPFDDELSASEKIAKLYKIKHKVINLPFLADIKGQKVWVPNRNGLFLNIAGCFCDRYSYNTIIFGANKDEAANFPDNSADFIKLANKTLKYSCKSPVEIFSPLQNMTKKEIVKYAISNNLDLELIKSCYNKTSNGKKHCGKCCSCRYLKRAILANNKAELLEKLGF